MQLFKLAFSAGIGAAALLSTAAPANAQAGTEFIGQVSAFAGSYCPRGWSTAEGQLLPISQNTALFSLYGTFYGGDGRTTFALPDLRGRRPVSQGNAPGIGSFVIGQKSGGVSFVLSAAQLPSHSHTGTVKTHAGNADSNSPLRNTFAFATNGTNVYSDQGGATNNMARDTLLIQPVGASQPVDKVSPYQTIRWCVALTGIYPSRS